MSVPAPRRALRFLAAFLALAVLAALVSPRHLQTGFPVFYRWENLTNVLRQVSENGILAVGMTFVILAGGIDLSVGSLLALANVLAAWGLVRAGLSAPAAALLAVLGAGLVGFMNGAFVARARIQPFVVTLATMSIARGLAFLCSGGRGIVLPVGTGGSVDRFAMLGSSVGGFPVQGAIFLALASVAGFVLARTAVGRHVYALGGNAEAARLSGVRVERVQLLVYTVSGLLAGVAGVIHVATLRNGHPAEGMGWELNAIAATVLGGTHLSGGRGSVAGAAAGAVFIGVLNNLLGLRNVDPYVQMLLKGALILAAVLVQRRGVDRIPAR